MTHSYIHTSVLNPVILNTNNIINLLSHPLSLSDYVWIVHSTLVTITTYTTDEVIIFIFVYVLWYQMNGKHPCRTTWMIHVYGLDFQHHMSWSLFCSVSEVRGDCSFHWYWWNCWPSLIKLSFHKHFGNTLLLLFNNWHKGNP